MFLPHNLVVFGVIHHKCGSYTINIGATLTSHFPVVKSGHHFFADLEERVKVGAGVEDDHVVLYVVNVHVVSRYQVDPAARWNLSL